MPTEEARDYFEFIADLGMTKHYGSLDATRELIDRCHIEGGQHVLDVGCGVGATPSYLADTVGCRAVGVDLIAKMIAQSRRRAEAAGVENRVAFAVADAGRLPFEDDRFDAVIAESVTVFFDDKHQPMRDYIRVTRPGGYVGITEMTWLQPPAPDLAATFKELAYVQALDADGWQALLADAGLLDVVARVHRIDLAAESKGRLARYGRWGIVKILLRMLGMLVGSRRARRIMGGGVGALSKDKEALDVVGYGVYAGRKA